MPETFRTPQGTFDVLPPDSRAYETLVARFARRARGAGYGLIISPMFEDVGVFQRVGESTDVVRKEMYDFLDKGGRHIALRPEMTASIMRAYLQRHRDEIRAVDVGLAAFVSVTTVEALTHSAVLHHPEVLADERVGALVDEVTRLVVGYLR